MGNITYDNDNFYKDGKKHVILAGAMHYFRIPREYWYDRLLKLKECGFNTVETYTCWNLHEPREGEFNFSGNLDVVKYIETAKELGLDVILRPGPYICAEMDFGGLPAWLLKYEKMQLRCNDETFVSKVERYFKVLLAKIKPLLSTNGGNVTMIQVENEYGSYGNDKEYLAKIVEIYKKCGIDCLYFTSDGPDKFALAGGAIDGCLAVANFGSKPEMRLAKLKEFHPNQPVMCGEYWCGWFDHWFEEHHTRTAKEIADDFEGFFKIGASLNFYMFHGGTNFGFTNGANYDNVYRPTVTSYDYSSPLSEAGDRTPTYYAVRDIIQRYYGNVPPITATETKKIAYGKVELTECADLFENLDRISKPIYSPTPKFMEEFGQNFGYILYRSVLKGPREKHLGDINIENVHDRAQIFVDGELKGTYCRWALPVDGEKVNCGTDDMQKTFNVDILVENMGRVNYGAKIRDRKGIDSVILGIQSHFGWNTYCLSMEDELDNLCFKKIDKMPLNKPSFVKGYLEIEGEPCDTFLRLDGFHKGFVKINGVNIGRYFNDAGPQKTLFVPAPFLKPGKNEILVFESDAVENPTVEFCAEHDLGSQQNCNFL